MQASSDTVVWLEVHRPGRVHEGISRRRVRVEGQDGAAVPGRYVQVQRGTAMNNWLQAMKQWAHWLMGDAPLPDGRSKTLLAGTVAAAAMIAVGVPTAFSSSSSANAASHRSTSTSQD